MMISRDPTMFDRYRAPSVINMECDALVVDIPISHIWGRDSPMVSIRLCTTRLETLCDSRTFRTGQLGINPA